MENEPFLSKLLRKKAAVLKSQEKSSKNMSSALREVNRQIKQCLCGGDPTKGEGVTKSGVCDD